MAKKARKKSQVLIKKPPASTKVSRKKEVEEGMVKYKGHRLDHNKNELDGSVEDYFALQSAIFLDTI